MLDQVDGEVDLIPEDRHNVRIKRPDIARAIADLGHAPTVKLEEGVPETLDWMDEPGSGLMGTATDVRRALYGAMAGDGTLTGMLATAPGGYSQSIYYQQAPSAAGFPYVIFNKQAGTPAYAMGPMPAARLRDNDIWLIKGIDRSDTADIVDDIASRLDALLTDGALSISGRTQLYLRRESDVVYPEVSDGVVYRHAGSLFRLMYS